MRSIIFEVIFTDRAALRSSATICDAFSKQPLRYFRTQYFCTSKLGPHTSNLIAGAVLDTEGPWDLTRNTFYSKRDALLIFIPVPCNLLSPIRIPEAKWYTAFFPSIF